MIVSILYLLQIYSFTFIYRGITQRFFRLFALFEIEGDRQSDGSHVVPLIGPTL